MGGKSGGVDGDVWSTVWKVLVSVCRMCGPSPEKAQVLFKVQIFLVERVKVDDMEVMFSSDEYGEPQCRPS